VCHLAHILILSVQAGQSCKRIVAKFSFHNSLAITLNLSGCEVFFTMFPFPSLLFCFFLPLPSLPSPSFLSSGRCLLSVGIVEIPWIFLNVFGSVMCNILLRTLSIRLLNLSTLLLTWDREFCASVHILSKCCTHLSTANSYFAEKNSSKAIWQWKLFLLQLIMMSSCQRIVVHVLSSLKKMLVAAVNGWICVPSPLKLEGRGTDCLSEVLSCLTISFALQLEGGGR
jgi:hypothetical protein